MASHTHTQKICSLKSSPELELRWQHSLSSDCGCYWVSFGSLKVWVLWPYDFLRIVYLSDGAVWYFVRYFASHSCQFDALEHSLKDNNNNNYIIFSID